MVGMSSGHNQLRTEQAGVLDQHAELECSPVLHFTHDLLEQVNPSVQLKNSRQSGSAHGKRPRALELPRSQPSAGQHLHPLGQVNDRTFRDTEDPQFGSLPIEHNEIADIVNDGTDYRTEL